MLFSDFTIPEAKRQLWKVAESSIGLLIFALCSHTAPDVAFLFVFVQNFPDLQIQRIVTLPKLFRQGFVNGGLGNAELLCGFADSGTGFNHVHSQCAGALF
jgi:hypothetical protein